MHKVLDPLTLLGLLQYNTNKIIPKVVNYMNKNVMPLFQSRGRDDLRGYAQKLNQSLNVFLSHPDLKDVPFANVLLVSAVISVGNKNDVYYCSQHVNI